MILVTGSTGNVGSEVCRQLYQREQPFRALTRDPDTARKALPESTDVHYGNYADPDSLIDALGGVERLFLASPAAEDMVEHQCAVIDCARQTGAKHVVKLSGLGASTDANARLPRLHAEIENHLVDSGLAYTIIRPNLFMQVLLMSANTVKSDGALFAPAGDGRISFTDVRDVAAVVVEALIDPTAHRNRRYEITGPEARSFADAAALIGEHVGNEVNYVSVSPDQARESMLGGGMPVWLAEAMLELFAIYRAGNGEMVTAQIEEVTGSAPYDLPRFVADHRLAFA